MRLCNPKIRFRSQYRQIYELLIQPIVVFVFMCTDLRNERVVSGQAKTGSFTRGDRGIAEQKVVCIFDRMTAKKGFPFLYRLKWSIKVCNRGKKIIVCCNAFEEGGFIPLRCRSLLYGQPGGSNLELCAYGGSFLTGIV